MKYVLSFPLKLYIILICSVRINNSKESFLESLLHSSLNELWARLSSVDDVMSTSLIPTARIVGGQVARSGEFPYMVALRNLGGKLLCGGSIINSQHVLTAAHCVKNVHPQFIRVMSGSQILSDYRAGIERGVTQIYTNVGFNFNSFDWDVAILKLSSPLTLSAAVQSICLSSNKNRYHGRQATVIGWGRRREADQRSSDSLRKVNVPIINSRVCQRSYRHFRGITDRMLCAGFRRGGKDSCQGDSGGPLILRTGAKIVQLGIVSWGNGCARPSYYGVYTRISKVLPWIKRYTTVQECT